HAIAIAMIVSTFKYKRIQFFLMLILLFFVFARYYQLVYSPVRVPGEMSHLERFENYCSIFNERECQR
ncbi:EpsG family protein, partial [Salmonella enterica]|nr:EpsG family protein [Salmonella enterica]